MRALRRRGHWPQIKSVGDVRADWIHLSYGCFSDTVSGTITTAIVERSRHGSATSASAMTVDVSPVLHAVGKTEQGRPPCPSHRERSHDPDRT